MDRFRLGVAQMTSVDRTEENLQQLEDLYAQAKAKSADMVVFPENALYFRVVTGGMLTALTWDGYEMRRLQKMVDASFTALMLTTPLGKGSLPGDSTVLIRPKLKPEIVYTKIHLFDVDVDGAPPVRESAVFSRGDTPRIVEFKGWKFGLSICYDMRFSELYSHYGQKVDAILVPSSFLVPTGQAHWHVLLRARAIESQCFVAAPAQSGEHRSKDQARFTFGHSLVVDPWGKILSEQIDSPAVDVVVLERSLLENVRRQIPMASHRRLNRV